MKNTITNALVSLYWGIGKRLTNEIYKEQKAEYGKHLVTEIGKVFALLFLGGTFCLHY